MGGIIYLRSCNVFIEKGAGKLPAPFCRYYISFYIYCEPGFFNRCSSPRRYGGRGFFTPFIMALLLLVVCIINKQEGDLLWGILPLAVFSAFAMFYPKGVIPPTPNKISVWAYLFFNGVSIKKEAVKSASWKSSIYNDSGS